MINQSKNRGKYNDVTNDMRTTLQTSYLASQSAHSKLRRKRSQKDQSYYDDEDPGYSCQDIDSSSSCENSALLEKSYSESESDEQSRHRVKFTKSVKKGAKRGAHEEESGEYGDRKRRVKPNKYQKKLIMGS